MSLAALTPLIVLAVAAMVTLLIAAFARHHALVAGTGVIGLVLFLASMLWAPEPGPNAFVPLLAVDRLAHFHWSLIGLTTLVVMLLCYRHFQPSTRRDQYPHQQKPEGPVREESAEELYGLLLLASLGASVLAASDHFVSLFLGLELLSLSLFILVAYRCRAALPIEAGVKYLVLSGLATGFLLFGIALVYTYSGTLAFGYLDNPPGSALGEAYWYAGMALIVAGLAFKLSLAPFHFWTPDVYQGASAPVTAYLATVSKAAVLVVLLRLVQGMELEMGSPTWAALAGMAGASMLVGNWLALRQNNLKRLLAYSSIAHMGYAMAALLAAGALAAEAVSFYLAFYVITSLGAFGIIVVLSDGNRGAETEAEELEDLQGLFWRQPFMAFIMTLMILSLAGIPLTAGFFGKFYVLVAGAEAGLWRLLLLVALGSAVGLYYYLRVILTMLTRREQAADGFEVDAKAGLQRPGTGSHLAKACLVALTLALLWLGIYPEPMMALVRSLGGV